MERKSLERLASAPFVGREALLAHLGGVLARARNGRSGWVLLSGEAGIGKTRSAEELAARAAAGGFAVHLGRCPETAGAPPYRPWVQVLRSAWQSLAAAERVRMRADLGAGATPLEALLPELARDGARARAPASGAEARFLLFESVAAFLRAAGARTPRLLVFDDLQGADEATLALLAFCARELADARLVVLATRREPADEPASASEGDARIALARAFEELPVSAFGDGEVRAFFRALTDREPADGFVAAVRERTDGNPLFLTELARLLALQDRLDPSDAASAEAAGVPAGARHVLGARIARLSPACRRVLARAAVLGRDVRRDLLERALEPDLAGSVGALLDEALTARILARVPDAVDTFRFSHLRMRDLLYEGLALDERARLHARVARALETLHPLDPGPVSGELAHHFRAATAVVGAAPAAHWAVVAGREAARRLAFDDARSWFANALALLGQVVPDDQRAALERDRQVCAARIELARACERAGDVGGAHAEFRRAGEAARRFGDAELFARAVLGLAGERSGTGAHAPDRERVALLEEALAQVGPERPELRVPLLGRLAIELHWSPTRERRDGLAHEAIALARSAGDPIQLAQALAGAIWATWSPDNAAFRCDAASEVIAAEGACDDPVPVLGAFTARAVAHLELGDAAAFDADVDAGARRAAELHLGLYEIYFRSLRGMRAILSGRFEEGERLAGESLAQARRVDSAHTPGVYASHILLIRTEQGRAAELEPAFAAAAERSRAPIVRASHAWLLVQLGRLPEARVLLRGLVARKLADVPPDFFWLGTVALLADVAAAVEERRAARVLYDALLPYADRVVVVGMSAGSIGSAARSLGLLAAALGRLDDAEQHFEAALETNARLRALPFLARTQDEYAAMLRARGRSGDLERAEKLEDEATALRAELSLGAGPLASGPAARDDVASAVAPPIGAGAYAESPFLARRADDAAPAGRVRPDLPRDAREERDAGGPPAQPATRPAVAEGAAAPALVRSAGGWEVRFGGAEARLRDARGVGYLARLLAEPERELHVFD
ncbi:MAG TPA: AAA family ATPase, partial [Myxococcota bacterium]|nr:AAA family ATPase [Myxococcota bacterium]